MVKDVNSMGLVTKYGAANMSLKYALYALALVTIMLATPSCSRWEPAPCSNGHHCPPGYACNASDVCIVAGVKCGNSIREADEACDDGNTESNDGCSHDCKTNETCGNGFLDKDETCDDGNRNDNDDCSGDCQSNETCGNGVIDRAIGEECDDNGREAGDGCDSNCLTEFCGNGRKDVSEICDGTVPLDPTDELWTGYCNKECTSNGACGNGIKDPFEACDDGDTSPGGWCRADCTLAICGDGLVDEGEECDCGKDATPVESRDPRCRNRANSLLDGYCRPDCKEHCGDGLVAEDEVCDAPSGLPLFCAGQTNESVTYDLGIASCNACMPDYTSCRSIHALPQPPLVKERLHGIWRAEPGNIFAVGDKGVVLRHSDNWVIERNHSNANPTLFDVGGSDPENIFAVGASGTILERDSEEDDEGKFHWRAIPRSALPNPPEEDLYGIWGSSSGHIFAVGSSGIIMHRPAGEIVWHRVEGISPEEDLHDVWGNDSGIFAVGTSGTILQRAPLTDPSPKAPWVKITIHPECDYHALWSDGATTYAVGTSGRIIYYTPEAGWDDDEGAPTDRTLTAIFGSSPTDLFAVGQDGTIVYRTGEIWSPVRSSTNRNFRDVYVADRKVIAIGDHGTLFSFTY